MNNNNQYHPLPALLHSCATNAGVDLCAVIADIILEYNPKYKYPRSLATTIIEMAHFQNFFMNNLPALTDFGKTKDELKVVSFLEDLVFSSIRKK